MASNPLDPKLVVRVEASFGQIFFDFVGTSQGSRTTSRVSAYKCQISGLERNLARKLDDSRAGAEVQLCA